MCTVLCTAMCTILFTAICTVILNVHSCHSNVYVVATARVCHNEVFAPTPGTVQGIYIYILRPYDQVTRLKRVPGGSTSLCDHYLIHTKTKLKAYGLAFSRYPAISWDGRALWALDRKYVTGCQCSPNIILIPDKSQICTS